MTRGVVVADGVPDDLPEVLAIERASYTNPWSEASLRHALAGGDGYRAFVCREDAVPPGRGVLGYCIVQLVADELNIHDVAVTPSARRQGHARRLVEEALAAGIRAGARTALLEVREGNQAARSLYESLGFAASGLRRGYYVRPSENAVLLRRELP